MDSRCLRTLETDLPILSVDVVDKERVLVQHGYPLTSSGDVYPSLKLWNIVTGECLKSFDGGDEPEFIDGVPVDGEKFLSHAVQDEIDKGDVVKLWNMTTGKCIRTFELEQNESYIASEFVVDGTTFTYAHDYRICRRDMKTGERTVLWQGDDELAPDIVCVAIVDSEKLLVGFENGNIQLLNVDNGECIKTFEGHEVRVLSIVIVNETTFLSCACPLFRSEAKLWDMVTGQCIRRFEGSSNEFRSIAYLEGDMFLTRSNSKLWSFATGKCIRTFPGELCAYIDSDTVICAADTDDDKMKVFAITNWPLLKPLILLRELVSDERAVQTTTRTNCTRGDLALGTLVGKDVPDDIFQHILSFLV